MAAGPRCDARRVVEPPPALRGHHGAVADPVAFHDPGGPALLEHEPVFRRAGACSRLRIVLAGALSPRNPPRPAFHFLPLLSVRGNRPQLRSAAIALVW